MIQWDIREAKEAILLESESKRLKQSQMREYLLKQKKDQDDDKERQD